MDFLLIIGIIGALSAWIGILSGILLSFVINKQSNKFREAADEFIAGMMISIVFFDLLPASVKIGNIYITSLGIGLRLLLTLSIENKLKLDKPKFSKINNDRSLKSAIYMAMAIALHHLPMGFALGSLYLADPNKGVHLALVIILHGIPEGFILGSLFNESNMGILTNIFLSIFTAVPTGLAAFFSSTLSKPSSIISGLSLALTSSIILHIIFSELLFNKNEILKGKSILGLLIGILIGILVISIS